MLVTVISFRRCDAQLITLSIIINHFIFSEPSLNGMDQWGAMLGTFQDNSMDIEKQFYLRSLRQRRWGQSNTPTLHR